MGNLLTLSHMKAICELDEKIRSVPEFQPICQASTGNKCCPSWSFPNYIALLSNKSSCLDINVNMQFLFVFYFKKVYKIIINLYRADVEGSCQKRWWIQRWFGFKSA